MRLLFLVLICVNAIFALSYNEKMVQILSNKEDNASTFTFAVFGDNRGGNDILAIIIQDINRDIDIRFALNNGDLTEMGFTYELSRYLQIIQKSQKPILSIIGNHEIVLFENADNYISDIGETNFSFSYKNSYFIILDDSDDEGVTNKQIRWLKNELKKSQKYNHRFVFMHIPLYDPRKDIYQQGHSLENLKQAKELNNLFDTYKVTMLFASHIHAYFRSSWQKTPFIITGGAGAPLAEGGLSLYKSHSSKQ